MAAPEKAMIGRGITNKPPEPRSAPTPLELPSSAKSSMLRHFLSSLQQTIPHIDIVFPFMRLSFSTSLLFLHFRSVAILRPRSHLSGVHDQKHRQPENTTSI